MKTTLLRFSLPVLAALAVASCTTPPQYTGPAPGVNTVYSSYGTGFVTYSRLPANYSGNAYYHGGRYYSGGRYERGTFTHNGRSYAGRYYHNGRYYYGGAEQYYMGGRQGLRRQDNGGNATVVSTNRRTVIGSPVNTSPITDTTSNRNADIYDTSATRGPAISFQSSRVVRRTYDDVRVSR